jgi:hypothetical protein
MNQRPKPEPPRRKPGLRRHVSGRNEAAARQHDGDSGDQGIEQDDRGQDQPADSRRARENR